MDILRNKQSAGNVRIPFVVTFHPVLLNIGEILHRLHPILQSSSRCREAIGGVPLVAFRRPNCLKDVLVHSELKTPVTIKGCVKCTDNRYRVCDYLVEGTRFSSGVTGKSYIINFNMGCNSDHVIYLISCARCAMFNNHKSRLYIYIYIYIYIYSALVFVLLKRYIQ